MMETDRKFLDGVRERLEASLPDPRLSSVKKIVTDIAVDDLQRLISIAQRDIEPSPYDQGSLRRRLFER